MNKFCSTLLLFFIALVVHGQQDEALKGDTLVIVKAYQPTLIKANKISDNPTITDTQKVDLTFDYAFVPKQFSSEYQVDTIEAAKIKGEPLIKLYNGYVRVGMGSNTTPLAEVFYNGVRSKKTSYGVHLKHFSSNGISSIKNSEFRQNEANLYGKKFSKKHTITGGLDYSFNKFNYYGDYFNPLLATVDLAEPIKIDQSYQTVGVKASIENTTTDSADMNYGASIQFRNLQDDYNSKENNLKLALSLKKMLDKGIGRLDLVVDNNNYKSKLLDSSINNTNTILKAHPQYKMGNEKWHLLVGLAVFLDAGEEETEFSPFPTAEFRINLIEEIIIPYAGIKGSVDRNSYRTLSLDNQFIASSVNLLNSNNKNQVYGGLRGSFSSRISFNASLQHGQIDNAPFYVKNQSNDLTFYRSFDVVYDDISFTQLSGELSYQNMEKLKVFLIGEFYNYETDKLAEAWHKPGHRITITGMYDLRDKIIVKLDLFSIGEQQARRISIGDNATTIVESSETLKGIVDANLGFEYRYTKKVAAFLNFNNIASVKYERWQDYPTQQFNLLGGLKFSF